MKTPPVVHDSFTLERRFAAAVPRVFAAWADVETKAHWFIGPPERWSLLHRELDFRVGGREVLQGRLSSGAVTRFEARYHAIVPNQRLVYDYDMFVGDQHLSASLATVELAPSSGGGTRMLFTEQVAFLDGEGGTASRRTGTDAHFDRLTGLLEDPQEIVSTRDFAAPRAGVYQAFADPEQLVRWWGPAGFTCRFQQFDLRPGGAWRFVMRGPDGTEYPNAKDFVEVSPPERIVYRHLQTGHDFTMTMAFAALGAERTRLTWRMRFDTRAAAAPVEAMIVQGNEENFDRLAAHLATIQAWRSPSPPPPLTTSKGGPHG